MIDYKKTIHVVGFDLDQTLYQKSPDIDAAIQGYIHKKIAEHKKCGIEEAEKLFKDLYKDGTGLSGRKTLLSLGVPDAEEIIQDALQRAEIARFLEPNKKVLNLLENIKNTYKNVDIITGDYKENAEKKLRELAIPKRLFSHIVTAEDGSKSDKSAYHLWMSFYPAEKPENFLYIGDRPLSDYEVPKKMGMHSILVNVPEKDPSISSPQLSSLLDIENLLL